YTYVAHLGETNQGSMDLLDVEDTTEPSGVEISFGVKEEDIPKAVDSIYRCTHFWDQHPTLQGITNYEIPVAYENRGFSHPSFFLLPTLPSWFQENTSKRKNPDFQTFTKNHLEDDSVFALVDGIPYDVSKVIPLELSSQFQG